MQLLASLRRLLSPIDETRAKDCWIAQNTTLAWLRHARWQSVELDRARLGVAREKHAEVHLTVAREASMSGAWVADRSSYVVRSCRKHGLRLAAAACIALGWSSATQAQSTQTIDFSTFPPGVPTTAWTDVNTQYQSLGLVVSIGAMGEAKIYNENCCGVTPNSLWHRGPVTLTFSPAVSRVQFYMGSNDLSFGASAYDAESNLKDSASYTMAQAYNATVVLEGSGITRVELISGLMPGIPGGIGIPGFEEPMLPEYEIILIDNLVYDQGSADADEDGTPDDEDGCDTDPNKIAAGVCGCGVVENTTDTDQDLAPDCIDQCPNNAPKTAPGTCGCATPDVDTDTDGTLDCNDECPMNSAKIEAGVCGCETEDVDADSDETYVCEGDLCDANPNKIAPGVCGCAVSDADTDHDLTVDCQDMCPTDPNKVMPGVCLCGTPDTDTDMDGTPDCNDLCDEDPNKVAPGVCLCGTPDDDADMDGVLRCNDLCVGNDSVGDMDQDGICNDRDDRVIIVTEEFSDARGRCEVGGVAITTGIDRNDNGTIEELESYGTDYACTGPEGPEGRQVRFLSTAIDPEDTRCPAGGVELRLGIDDNRNGVLDDIGLAVPSATEVDVTHNICKGQKTVAALVPIDPGEICETGGVEFSVGVDDNGNGILDTLGPLDQSSGSEVDFTEEICNGLHSVVEVTPLDPQLPPAGEGPAPAPEIECPTGGIHVAAGTDLNGNGELDDGEQRVEQNVCHGLNSLILTSDIEPGELCETGGFEVRAGTDENADGQLSSDEQSSYHEICNGLDGIVTLSDIEPNAEVCPTGGVRVTSGTDADADGEVDEGEQNFSRPVCHGLGTLVVSRSLAPDANECARGGAQIDMGVDSNGNGQLDENEDTSSETICNGLHSIVKTTELPKNPELCAAGGVHIEVGTDDNGNGTLDGSEVDGKHDLCQGDDALVHVVPLEPGAGGCPDGGARIATGTDADGDGSLDDAEASSSHNVCAGLSSVSRTSAVAANPAQCPFGGARLESGLDDDGDGMLDDNEVDSTQILCGGTGLAVRTRRLEVGSGDCPAGGVQVESGIDVNGDASLGDDEVQNSDPLCQPPALLFETETLGEDSERCAHGGLRVYSGHDDGDPDGTPGDGELQEEEIELDRDVCLAATDVLVNGGTGECTVKTVGARGNAWQALGLLLMAAVFIARRRKR
jgi:hypothetical protein